MYTEIDLLEIMKQLRISRFMSSVFLTPIQRELIKFMKAYVLYSNRKRKRRSFYIGDSSEMGDLEHPEEALLDFMPDKNECDAKLYEGIVEAPLIRKMMRASADKTAAEDDMINDEILNGMPARNNRYDEVETLTSSDNS